MTSKYLVFIASLFIFASCNYHEDYYDDFDHITEQGGDFDDDGGFDDQGGASGEEGALTLYKVNGNEIIKIKDFSVSNDLSGYQNDVDKHLQMWDFYTQLIPLEDRSRIVEFEVFYGANDLAGYVEPIHDNDLSRWKMGLAIEAAENINTIDFSNFFTYLTVHEFGHVLTLNETQVNVHQDNCPEYHTEEGCSNANSYINELYELGWKDIAHELQDGQGGEDLYNRYSDRFVSDYAATNPGEDIAEVFADFITKPRPGGNSIADQKVNLLYERPELVELRNKIISQNPSLQTEGLMSRSWATKFKFKCGHRH
jgi:hypothetical protein